MATKNEDHRPRFEHVLLFVLDEKKGMTRESIERAMKKKNYPLTQSALSRWTSAGERSDATPWGAAIRTERIEGEEWTARGTTKPKPGRKTQLVFLTAAGARYRDEVVRPFYTSLLS